MATYNLGRILPRFRGNWDPAVNYDKLDVVYFEGSSYMAISDNINKRPDENESDWILSAAKGEPGEPGKDGPTYKAGNGISIVNNVISATGGGSGSGETYYSGYGIDIDLATNQINAEVKASFDVSIEWKAVTIPGMEHTDVDNYDPANIFKFNNTIFYSAGPNHHYWLSYDKATDTLKWEPQIWSGFSDFTGQDVYVDVKGHLYYFKDRYQMEYTNAGWRITSINISNPKGRYMINGIDGKDYYFENGSKMYYRDDWESTTWDKISARSVNIDAQHIWSDSNSMYMSLGDNQLYFDFDRLRWRTMGWRGDIKLFDGGNIWKMNDDIFYSDGVATYQLTYSDYWKKLGQTPQIYGENIFIEPESERVISDVDGHTKELVKGEVKYITRHGDELATKDYVDNNGVISTGITFSSDHFTEHGPLSHPNTQPFFYEDNLYYTYGNTIYKYDIEAQTFNVIRTNSPIYYNSYPIVDYYDNTLYTTIGNVTYKWVNEDWEEYETIIMRGAAFGKYGIVIPISTNYQSYTYIDRESGTAVNRTKTFPGAFYVDNDGEIITGSYMLDHNGNVDIDTYDEGLNVDRPELHVWRDIDGNIRYDSVTKHMILIGHKWIDYHYKAESRIPTKAVSMVSFKDDGYIYISERNIYPTKLGDDIATEDFVKTKIGDIENLLKTI